MAEHDENSLVVELQTLRTEALARLGHLTDLTALDTWRIDYLSYFFSNDLRFLEQFG